MFAEGGELSADGFFNGILVSGINQFANDSRAHLLETLSRFGDKDLGTIPDFFKERKLAIVDVLYLVGWHEAHHQGQAHITLNLYKAAHS